MQTILIASLTLNVFLIAAITYLHRTEDKRRKKKERAIESEEKRRAIACARAYSSVNAV